MAANHIFGLGNPVPTAAATLVAAILVKRREAAGGHQSWRPATSRSGWT